ncbi:MAG: putative Ntn-hydrolase superfamily protein [Pseudomonadales bacterium]|jgi:uncharacterized Ntn-hydrolase superfamily protein
MWGVEGARRLTAGESAENVMSDFVARDAGQAIRQAHMIDAAGLCAAHTGKDCIDWAGHRAARDVSVAGNMLVGQGVVEDTLSCYLDNANLNLVERLLLAMEAGEAAGGDKRGRQAAGLRIHRGQDYPIIDLRADDHSDPLAELRRLNSVSQERAAHFVKTFPTAENFSGTTDRTELDRSIAEREALWALEGIVSQSFATPL